MKLSIHRRLIYRGFKNEVAYWSFGTKVVFENFTRDENLVAPLGRVETLRLQGEGGFSLFEGKEHGKCKNLG